MGGAIAQIAALDLKLNTDTYSGKYSIGTVNVITFGSPRWASQDLADVYDQKVDSNWRIVNEYDIVPTVPTMDMGTNGFYHSGIMYNIIFQILYVHAQTICVRVC